MKPWHKLMFAVILFSVPFLSSPKKLAAACYLDTHCDFYNDDAYTDWCGDEDLCVGCSTTNQASGCHTAYRWCQVYGACGGPHSCYQCAADACYSSSCP